MKLVFLIIFILIVMIVVTGEKDLLWFLFVFLIPVIGNLLEK